MRGVVSRDSPGLARDVRAWHQPSREMRYSNLMTACLLAACSRAPAEPSEGASPVAARPTAKVFIESGDAERIAARYAREHWGAASKASATHGAGAWHVDLEFDDATLGGTPPGSTPEPSGRHPAIGARAFVLLDEKGNVTQARMY
jgi:hypothetical protein